MLDKRSFRGSGEEVGDVAPIFESLESKMYRFGELHILEEPYNSWAQWPAASFGFHLSQYKFQERVEENIASFMSQSLQTLIVFVMLFINLLSCIEIMVY